ncbi:glycosyltransferase [Kineococcus sp. SYSU DK003]|uniref:glycosyltransferase n=1 Tax=Kineococcus sp. SYSU DK003 TaxID=3383124 RepID=UPI003D7F0CC9
MLHVVYRSHGGENAKGRPSWYSKQLALQSFLRAVAEADSPVDVVFLNDGPIPADRLSLMRAHGRVHAITGGSNRASYLAALKLAVRSEWADSDAVLFAEDDYLWRPDALRSLATAAGRGRVEYFAPYGIGTHDDIEGRVPEWRRPRTERGEDSVPADVVRWVPHESTTSTFAVRLGALREDHLLLVLCCLSGGDFDHTSLLAVQGIPRFTARDLVHHHPGGSTNPAVRLARALYLTLTRGAVDLASLRRPSRRRRLAAADPAVCTHMEDGWLAPAPAGRPRYWEDLAAQTSRWAEGRDAPSVPPVARGAAEDVPDTADKVG